MRSFLPGVAMMGFALVAQGQAPDVPKPARGGSAPLTTLPSPDEQTRALVDEAKRRANDLPDDAKALGESARSGLDSQLEPLRKEAQDAGVRAQALSQLGIPEDAVGYVTVFVTSAMPEGMLRSFANQAVWVGGTLAFRGVPPGQKISDFVRAVMLPLAKAPSHPDLIIDPRSFQAYEVTMAPTIVYSIEKRGLICEKEVTRQIERKNKPPVPINECAPRDPKTYWKISGSVTMYYALEQFAKAGAPGAERLLRAVRSDPIHGGHREIVALSEEQYQKATGPGNLKSVLDLMHRSPALPSFAPPASSPDRKGQQP
jgi:type-F conjugative transfer system pilin assembly protein TrbC